MTTTRILVKAETELTKARTGYQQYAADTTDIGRGFYAATVHHYLGETALQLHAGMTAREAHAIARTFETSTGSLAEVVHAYETTHTV